MRRHRAAAALAGAVLFATRIACHAQDGTAALVGLWQGIDDVDGSLRTISIELLDDGGLRVLANDTFWTLCNGPNGVESLTGTMADDGALHARGEIRCQSGAVVTIEAIFTPTRSGQLVEDVVEQPFHNRLFRIDR
jgi:hypothetical protein